MTSCSNCGSPAGPGRFCGNCGAQLPPSDNPGQLPPARGPTDGLPSPVSTLTPASQSQPGPVNTSTPGPHDSDYGNRHDGVLFLKLALLLLVILGVGLLTTGAVIGTSQITVAQGGSQTVCGSPFSPVKAGGAQPGGAILTQFGEWACQERMGILGQISTVMA